MQVHGLLLLKSVNAQYRSCRLTAGEVIAKIGSARKWQELYAVPG
jgi:hypothetical protein